ncbi:hypothetical protein [Salinisphaera sp. T31B1]|uniref:tetratricopeptide repeat protein n=1 Tax=Salinisphaera sp. T31B1 TaxID=727963 RepID=UPI00333F2A3F
MELSKELTPARSAGPQVVLSVAEHNSKLDAWRNEPTQSHAIDVVGSGLFSRDFHVPEEVVHQLIDLRETNTAVSNLLRAFLDGSLLTNGQALASKTIGDARAQIKNYRKATRNYPRNAFIWAELARAHISVGASEQAEREILTALMLAPEDRFITRSAVRFFVHVGDFGRAKHVLANHRLIKKDPWLVAPELAVSQLMQRTSKLVGLAKKIVSSGNYSSFHVSELESALASVELESGARKKSRKHFAKSLVDPTENSVAQAIWGRSEGLDLDFDLRLLDLPGAYEAKTLEYAEEIKWDKALEQCELWQNDEVFSSRPAEIGSYIAAVALGDPLISEKFSRRGLSSNPRSITLKNNLTVCLCQQGRLNEALDVFQSINFKDLKSQDRNSLLATTGLINFRLGNLAAGRENYELAIRQLRARNDKRGVALAIVHLAQEEKHCGSGLGEKILEGADKQIRASDEPEILAMHNRLVNANLGEFSTDSTDSTDPTDPVTVELRDHNSILLPPSETPE